MPPGGVFPYRPSPFPLVVVLGGGGGGGLKMGVTLTLGTSSVVTMASLGVFLVVFVHGSRGYSIIF